MKKNKLLILILSGLLQGELFSTAWVKLKKTAEKQTKADFSTDLFGLSGLGLIVGGFLAEANQFPSTVSIHKKFKNHFFCSGVLIHPRVVLTAAHCVYAFHKQKEELNKGSISKLLSLSLFETLESPEEKSEKNHIIEFDFHEDYDDVSTIPQNDIAFLVLKNDVQKIKAASILEITSKKTILNHKFVLVGFGDTLEANSGQHVPQKRFVELALSDEYLQNEEAFKQNKIELAPSKNAQKGLTGLGAGGAKGDSGGGLYLKMGNNEVLVGLASHGTSRNAIETGSKNRSVYQIVSPYVQWLQKKLTKHAIELPSLVKTPEE